MDPLELHFLGTGGGRHAMCTQKRRTAGIRVIHGLTQIHIDPGPGALVHSIYANLTPMRLDGVVVTHRHPDHYTDTEVLIEAMTQGTTRRQGVLAASKSVLECGDDSPCVSGYHQKLPERVEMMLPGSEFSIKEFGFKAIKALHSDEEAVSIRFNVPEIGDIAYTSDTEVYERMAESYIGLRLMILCTLWPRGSRLKGHLSTDDVVDLIREAAPKCVITTHFGIKMLNADPVKDAEFLEVETEIPVVAATDGMVVRLDERITARGPRKNDAVRIVEG